MRLGEKQTAREMQRMKETGKIDGLIGAKEVGRIIDHHNSLVEKKKEDHFHGEIAARNKYYWKLWKSAIRDMKAGVRPKQNISRIKPGKKVVGGNGVITL